MVKQKQNSNFCKRKKKAKKRNILQTINKVIIVLIIICGVGTVVCINDLSIKGFVLRELKLKAADLDRKSKEKELIVTNLESYDNIVEKARELSMVKVDKIDYITVMSAMAKK